ncbi:hypothetical protein VE01_07575 [Pseudogymnoascus verrucosus]|uniref:Uncharacterized protein n=1 Tax=Pseudogymnoascus verrucosus TaxID=342668 RepID=A0A1B8GHB5_9PEZI|nr:uncharacterized protein VE01_07575 [Pseudogymnoascus verrucosus]OBT95232.1 hypothetical protein VE01_07575 [Pseudogymnoascus verrucosus]
MKFPTIPLLITALASIAAADVAAADNTVYGIMFSPPQQNTARTPSARAITHASSHIKGRQVFSLGARQTCGHGSTCKEICEGCGTTSCGVQDTDGSCICANEAGSCAWPGDGSESGSGGSGSGDDDPKGAYSVSPYCGWGATCLESCDACGTDYCGVRLMAVGNACVCRSLDGECPSGSAGDHRVGLGRGNGTSSDSTYQSSTTGTGTDLPKSTGDVSSETTTSGAASTTQDSTPTQTSDVNLPGAAPGRMEVAVGAAVVGVAALVMAL